MSYAREIFACRHFWLYLARAEVRARFRRSRLGAAWALLQPLSLTLLMSFVLGAVFHLPMREFAPFVFSGMLVWEYVFGAAQSGCLSLIQAAPYICQRRLPLAIYPLKTVLASSVVFLIGTGGLVGWVLVTNPATIGWGSLSLLTSLPLLFLTAWPIALLAAFINTKLRDFQQLVGLLLQALWYASPVFIEPRLFQNAGLGWLLECNPVTHVLNLVRAPLLAGSAPRLGDYLYSAALATVLWWLAARRIRHDEARMVFYV